MAFDKAITANDIINGVAAVCTGKRTQLFDATDRNRHFTAVTQVPAEAVLQTRFIFHGGDGGSGNWEH